MTSKLEIALRYRLQCCVARPPGTLPRARSRKVCCATRESHAAAEATHSGNSGRGIFFPRRRAPFFSSSWSGAEAAAGELDDGAWAKRLCQSCGLPVSQVLMCTLSATLAEKIGQARSLSTAPTSGTQISPPPARPTACPAATYPSRRHGRRSGRQLSPRHAEPVPGNLSFFVFFFLHTYAFRCLHVNNKKKKTKVGEQRF